MKYYRLVVNGYEEKGGVFHAPEEWPYPIARDAEEVENWQSLIVELRDGVYCPFHMCSGSNMVSEEMKNCLCSFIEPDFPLEFLPVKVVSKEYGNRTYFIMHFTKIFDVIDKEHTHFFNDVILKIAFNYDKVKNLKIFNSRPSISDVNVSEDVKKAIKKAKLDFGLIFMPIYAY